MDDDHGSQAESANVADNVTGPVVQARDVAGNLVLNVGQPAKPVARVPRELPLDVAAFAGREEELAELDRLRDQASGAVVISAVSGTAGVGKTALAVHWAHRVRAAYPDGDLYVDLRGYDPNQPVSPEEALGELLRSLVGSAEPVPATLSDRSRLFRTLVAERRMLIVLDNARSVEQVRPLLPGAGSTFVLVTSRDSLGGLVIRDGASRVHLGLLEPDEAFGLFAVLVGERAAAEPAAARQLCEWSTYLPLALRITAEMVNARPDETLAALVAELAGADRLDLMEAGDERTAVRTVFSWSYRHLSPSAARAFRCLGIAPGRDVDARAVAALTGTSVADARKAVTELERAHLVQPVGNGRVRAHDLLRSYAADLSAQTDDDRDAALARLFHYYVTAACRAVDVALPNRRSGWRIGEVETPGFADSEAAWRWLREEQPNLAATLGALSQVRGSGRSAAADEAAEPSQPGDRSAAAGEGQEPRWPEDGSAVAGEGREPRQPGDRSAVAGEGREPRQPGDRSAAADEGAEPSQPPVQQPGDLSAAADLVRESTRSAAEQVLGLIAQHSGDLPAALTHFERAWRLTPDAGHALWLDQVDTLLAAGMPNRASVYLNDVLDLLHSARMADDRLIAQVEHVRAQCALLQSDFKCAREAAWEAATRFRRVCDERAAVVAELTTLRATMSLARAWRDKSAAQLLAFAEKLAGQLDGLNLPDESDQALLWAARLSVSFGDVEAARRYVARTAAPRDGAPLDHVVFRWLVMAELAAEQGETGEALDCASSGLDRLLAAFDRYGATDLVRGAGLFGRELGDLAVRIALKRGDGPEAVLTWLERARAHLHRHQPATSPDPAVSEAVDDFIRLARTVQQQRVNGPVEADLAQRHEIALQRVSHLGWWSTTCVGSDALVSVQELADALGDKAFVSFVVSGDALAAVVVADGAEHLVPLGRSSVMTEQARQLHFDLAAMAPDNVPQPVSNVIAHSAHNRLTSLDAQLIRPLLPIVGERPLVVVPVGQLYGVPWGSLPSLVGRPVAVAPSATAWFRALTAAQDERTGQALLVVGPGVSSADERLARLHRNAVTIATDDASLTAVQDALRTSDFVHLACHGRHEPDNALFSRLELADAPLHAHDFGRLERRPRQVVLAACGLALTDIRPGDELLGFAGALLSVGTSTVVVAVNRVGELAARAAMEELHRGLLGGATAAEALAAAVAGDPLRRPYVCVGADSVLSTPRT